MTVEESRNMGIRRKIKGIRKLDCKRCKHVWIPRQEIEPGVCPRCKSPFWREPFPTKILPPK
jgi:predicted Zn-ribbon and HTH transcriptional regulator